MQNNQKNNFDKSKNQYIEMEKDVLNFWQRAEIFRKSVTKDAPKGDYVFNDGPPFITGLPHYATLLPSVIKDVIPRYWTMKGYRVRRVWGWDCHGLPAENKVEQQLGLKNKKDIEKIGIDKFIKACRDYVNKGSEQWEWYINRIGRWVDMKNAYRTMDLTFMESVIWAFKKLYDKGFIYEGYRTSLHCPRCATPLSKFEITMDAGSYRTVTSKSVIVRFKIKNSSKAKKLELDDNSYLLVWTTTPWTLPGNLVLAVGGKIDYYILEVNSSVEKNFSNEEMVILPGKYIIACDRLKDLTKNGNYFSKKISKIKGKDLVGLEYEPIYLLNDDKIKNSDKVYKVYSADFVTSKEGTGIVHIAPNFGEDDFNLAKKVGLPMIDLMDENGIYLKPTTRWKNYYFQKVNKEILTDLKDKKNIFSIFDFTHEYPFCYRCGTPLIYKTQKAWYFDIQKIKKKMLETNKQINWVPEYFKYGRFKNNIKSAPDWCLSRSRYWGSPIPVWRCDKCGKIKVLGSIKEIEKLSGKKVNDLHRPDIDKYTIKCECGGTMKRVKEVLDCWFESGAMSFAQFHYPFESKEDFKNRFPADFIIEYTGQLRGWFYYLHVLSNSLFNSISFKNVIVSGVLSGTDGRKMSKSFGNYTDPRIILERYGSDALRMYFVNSPIMLGDDINFSESDIKDALRKNVITLWNVVKFYALFASSTNDVNLNNIELENILDVWILTRLNQLIKQVTENLEKYNLPNASRPISGFIDDLSTWYIRRSRERFKGDNKKDKLAALTVTKFVLIKLSKVIAPFIPFIAEQVWQNVAGYNFEDKNKSVHLETWPKPFDFKTKIKGIDVLNEMEQVRNIIELALSKRVELGIKIRQPLQKIIIKNYKVKDKFKKLILDELNVKEIICKETNGKILVELDTKITPELRIEGIKREIVRLVNLARKNSGLNIKDRTEIFYFTKNKQILTSIKTFEKEILKDTLSNKIERVEKFDNFKDMKINGEPFKLGIKKIVY